MLLQYHRAVGYPVVVVSCVVRGVGRVNDASTGKSFYGPGGPYAMFAGKDTSRALAKMSKNDDDIPPSLDDLSDKAIDVLNDWENKFQAKYLVVARVLN
ncbi:hypothetical protein GYH30_033591 [Glycine max]|uniref:Uncharacterized protein n=1 Tax=Glycine max TaxID=3847 RepID=K7LUI1_SOYBN|nr:hypothetical protein GYH30_033591 [Glycine max]